jgi:ATP-dependent Lhr-like helicase
MTGRDGTSWIPFFVQLLETGRASAVKPPGEAAVLWVARERLEELGDTKEMLRGRVGILGPASAAELGAPLGLSPGSAEAALLALEAEGVVLRGRFTPGRAEHGALEWADRRLLARIHRYTLNRLRAEIEPVSSADFMRFLFSWQHVEAEHRVAGLEGLASVVAQLDGFEVPAGAWEPDVLALRCEEYDPALLDALCLSGRVAWGRRPSGGARTAAPIRTTPIALFLREHAERWLAGRPPVLEADLAEYARAVRGVLDRRGASFFHELVAASGLLPTQVERALAELAGAGLVSSDSFAGLRALITPSARRKPPAGGVRRHATVPFGIEGAGRVQTWAETLLRRYGIVFRGLLQHETGAPPWRELLLVYRRLEARGEIRGGRFVAGMGGEQFALPAAVTQLRAIRRGERTGNLVAISAADPLNLTGVITPGERVPALAGNRILYREGAPVLALIAGEARPLAPLDADRIDELSSVLVRRPLSPALRRHLGIRGTPAHLVEHGRRRRRPVA